MEIGDPIREWTLEPIEVPEEEPSEPVPAEEPESEPVPA